MEHGTINLETLDRLLPFCQAIGLKAYVRLSEATRPNIQNALDIGADAIILPSCVTLSMHAKSPNMQNLRPWAVEASDIAALRNIWARTTRSWPPKTSGFAMQ